jgi:cytochrome c-type biogenesis protein CcmH/NrfG
MVTNIIVNLFSLPSYIIAQAIRAYTKALKMSPDNVTIAASLAGTLLAQGKVDEALQR